MLANKWFRVVFVVFIALVVGAWIAKPKPLGSQLAGEGFHFKSTVKIDDSLPLDSTAGYYLVSAKERAQLITRLQELKFEKIPDSNLLWYERPYRFFPPQSHQQVFFSPEKASEVVFLPDLR